MWSGIHRNSTPLCNDKPSLWGLSEFNTGDLVNGRYYYYILILNVIL